MGFKNVQKRRCPVCKRVPESTRVHDSDLVKVACANEYCYPNERFGNSFQEASEKWNKDVQKFYEGQTHLFETGEPKVTKKKKPQKKVTKEKLKNKKAKKYNTDNNRVKYSKNNILAWENVSISKQKKMGIL